MEREILKTLEEWRKKDSRKPLILTGARQVGKTWLLREFGRKFYKNVAYINFEDMSNMKDIFKDDFDMTRILILLNAASGVSIVPADTLVILDEIQSAENGLTALKYFYEKIPQYHVVAAGSLLGIELHRHSSYPVGKVEQVTLYPMNFREFLRAAGETELCTLLENRLWEATTVFSSRLKERLKQYYYIGGMPEVVDSFVQTADFRQARAMQKQILTAYERDFSKHAPVAIVPRIKALWNSIPAQLARENRKFIYGAVKESARAKDYELALQWLSDCGLCYQIFNISTAQYPLKSVEERDAFKLFVLDVGLLAAMTDLSIQTFLNGNSIFTNFKGALTEQYVCQQLLSATPYGTPYYWASKTGKAEVDFIVQREDEIVPIEVKAEENLQAKSLKIYVEKFSPKTVIRTSMSNYRTESWMTNFPLYLISEI